LTTPSESCDNLTPFAFLTHTRGDDEEQQAEEEEEGEDEQE